MYADLHWHLERGRIDREYALRFLERGLRAGIQFFGVTEHTHHFLQFQPLYEPVLRDETPLGDRQRAWYQAHFHEDVERYVELVLRLKGEGWPIALGLEVCFFSETIALAKELLSNYPWDYLVGSVHWIDGWGFDFRFNLPEWKHREIDVTYRRYFTLLQEAARSGLFDVIAHPDSLKAYGHRPAQEPLALYHQVADTFAACDVATEVNTGLIYRYPVGRACPEPALLRSFAQSGVPITTVSDAHEPDDIGKALETAQKLAREAGYTSFVTFTQRRRISHSFE